MCRRACACRSRCLRRWGVAPSSRAPSALPRADRAWPSHHIGDLKNLETLYSFREGVEHFERLFAVEPRVIAHDLHPDYLSTRYALERADGDPELELVGVQHHHAHLAACLAEHGETGRGPGCDLRRHRLRRGRVGLGRRAPRRRPRGIRTRGHADARSPAGRRPRGSGAVADGGVVALACAWTMSSLRFRARFATR